MTLPSKKLISSTLIVISWFVFAFSAQAATLYFSPSSGSYEVGQNFTVSVYASSADQSMNAASGVISFPVDKLELTSLSKTGSIFSLWVEEPSFSNSAGTINFEGIALNPGFIGSVGKIITANFKVKALGSATLNFSSGSVLANDGKGTNILTDLGNAQFSLNPAATGPQAPEATTPLILAGVPLAPKISSPTNPDPEKWYNNPNPKFIWSVPSDVTTARLLCDKYPTSQPTILYSPAVSEKQLENLKDGVYYFHVQFKNAQGWGAIAHFRFQIDTTPPEPFPIKFVDGEETDNPQPTILFDANDSPSGIDYYKVKIGEGDFFNLPAVFIKSNSYILPLQAPGKRTILIQAFDKAGNYTVAAGEFIIKPIEAPIIKKYTEELVDGEVLKIEGQSYSNAIITVFLSLNDKVMRQEVKTDSIGNFIFVWPSELKTGLYNFWAEATDKRGAKSEKSKFYTLIVKQRTWSRIISSLISYLTTIISLLVIGFALFFFGYYLWYRFGLFKKKAKKKIGEAERSLHKAFIQLKEKVGERIETLEKIQNKRQLTKEEKEIIKQLKEDLDEVEKFVRKEIENIEKEVK